MDEKLKILCVGLLTVITFLIFLSETYVFISKFVGRKNLLSYQHKLKNYYEYYKDELENKVELNLDTPLHLNIPVYSAYFSTNTELRRSFLQVCYIFRDLSKIYESPLTEETEKIFKDIRQIAYQNGEAFERHSIE